MYMYTSIHFVKLNGCTKTQHLAISVTQKWPIS